MELRGTGIHVSLIEPGPITTRFRANARERFHHWIDWRASARRDDYERVMHRLDDAAPDRFELPPSAVTAALLRALDAPRPAARYRVTTPTVAAMVLKRLLPTRLLDRIVSQS